MIHPTLYSGSSFKGMRIGLLGGSFNPAHEAHIAMSLHALKKLQLHQVWWLVSPQNPLKDIRGMARLPERVAQAKKMASRHPAIQVTTLESQLGTRYTTQSLRRLKQRYPQTHFVWLMGADNLIQFSRWRQWHSIFKQVPIAVFVRPGYAVGRHRGKAAGRFDRAWRATQAAKLLAIQTPPAWLMLDNRLNKLSATSLRQQQLEPNQKDTKKWQPKRKQKQKRTQKRK